MGQAWLRPNRRQLQLRQLQGLQAAIYVSRSVAEWFVDWGRLSPQCRTVECLVPRQVSLLNKSGWEFSALWCLSSDISRQLRPTQTEMPTLLSVPDLLRVQETQYWLRGGNWKWNQDRSERREEGQLESGGVTPLSCVSSWFIK